MEKPKEQAAASYGIPPHCGPTTIESPRMTPQHPLPPSRTVLRACAPTAGRLLAAIVAMGLLGAPGTALAKRAQGSSAAAEAPRKKGVSKITYQRSPSEESPAQRDRRLKRECKGMHNAGACLGYTR